MVIPHRLAKLAPVEVCIWKVAAHEYLPIHKSVVAYGVGLILPIEDTAGMQVSLEGQLGVARD